MIKNVLILALLVLKFSNLYADSGLPTAMVLYKSSSERTVALDRGDLEDFKEGMVGKILIQRGPIDHPTLFLVGTGRIVKSFPNKSIWLMEKNYIKDKMQVNESIIVVTDRYTSIGRKTSFKQRQVVINPNEYADVNEYIDQNQNNVPDKLINHKNEFEESDDIFSESKIADIDKEFATYDFYHPGGSKRTSDTYGDDIKSVTYLVNNKFRLGDLKKKEDVELLNSDTENLIKKINSQKYSLNNGLYIDSKKSPIARDISDKITISSSYEIEKQNRREAKIVDEKALAKIKRDGDLWSADMDAKTLRHYVIKTGILAEKERRELAMNELDGHEILFSYAGNANTHVASEGIDSNYQTRGYNLTLGYDLHLSRISPDFKNWSMEFIAEKGIGYYDLGTVNGRNEEGAYGAYINYYLHNNPLTLNQFITLIGVGMKFGMTEMYAESLSKTYDYQLLTLPSVQLMTKYRFRAGDLTEDTANIGAAFNAGIMFENKNLSIVNSPSDTINSKISAFDIKYQFGMSFFF